MRKPFLSDLHKIYHRDTADKLLYGFVRGCIAANPSISIPDAVRLFADHFGVEINIQSSIQTIYRVTEEVLEQHPKL